MTGGRVAILGSVGRNFAAGMSGGIAYVLDINGKFKTFCNMELVELVNLDEADSEELLSMLMSHLKATKSKIAASLIADWENSVSKFVKVFPRDYKKALENMKKAEKSKTDVEDNTTEGIKSSSSIRGSIEIETPPILCSSGGSKDVEDIGRNFASIRKSTVAQPKKLRGFIEYERGAI
eukprot:UC4_evm1s289